MGLRIGVIKSLFGGAKKIVQETPKAPQRMTRVFTDSSSGIVKMERNITRNGKEALATLEVSPNGSRRITIEGGDSTIWRTTQVKREKGASVFGGDKITVDKDYTQYWCYKEKTKLLKEYNPQGVLEHKELNYHKNIGNETFIDHKSVQDRVYNEYPLNGGYRDMLTNPNDSQYIKHTLDNKNNYHKFADGSSTNFTRAVQAKEQAVIDAAKKAEAEALAAKEAAEKAVAELRASQPRINISKALNRDINELTVKETKLANGTIERTFTDPESGKLLAKTQDLGILHKEWIYGGKADMIYMKQVGKDTPYILAKKGNYTQVSCVSGKRFKFTPSEPHYIKNQYYNDGFSSLKRSYAANTLYHDAYGNVTVYDKTAAARRNEDPGLAEYIPDYPKIYIERGQVMTRPTQTRLSFAEEQADKYIRELDIDAQKNFLNFDDLFSNYVG